MCKPECYRVVSFLLLTYASVGQNTATQQSFGMSFHHTMLWTPQLLSHQQTQGCQSKVLDVLYFTECFIEKLCATSLPYTLPPSLPHKLYNLLFLVINLPGQFSSSKCIHVYKCKYNQSSLFMDSIFKNSPTY